MKKGFRRFAMKAHGEIRFFIACDLDEGRLRYWPSMEPEKYSPLALSENLDERALARSVAAAIDESAYCIGVELSEANIARLEELLSEDNIESMRGIDDRYMYNKTGGWCYRDGWNIDFYTESDDGSLPCSIEGISYCSFDDDQEVFERVKDYVNWEILHECANMPYAVKTRLTPQQANDTARAAISSGIGAVGQILWQGRARLIKALGEVECDKLLKYTLSDDSFTVYFGNMRSKGCKLHELPNCVAIFGTEHTFHPGDERLDSEAND